MSVHQVLTRPATAGCCFSETFNVSDTVITDNYPQRQYDKKRSYYSESIGKAQKNVINAIQFLTRCDCDCAILVVVAPEWSIRDSKLILTLFPELKRIDVWVQKLSRRTSEENIRFRYGRPCSLSYSSTDRLLLMCEVLLCEMGDEMVIQENIVRDLRPDSSCVKFRPVLKSLKRRSSISYFDGEMHTVCFGRPSSLETRIYFDKDWNMKEYNITEYESKMFRYNVEVRNEQLDDRCFDMNYCLYILRKYIESRNSDETELELWDDILHVL